MAGYKILIIEDELVHLGVMETKLKNEGYDVCSATDGEAGYAMLEKEKPDLALLDIILPKLSGFDVLERMQKNGIKTPVIIVSNSGQPVEVDRAMKLGAIDYLVKADFSPTDVLEKIVKALGKPPTQTKPKKEDVSRPLAQESSSENNNKGNKGPLLLIIEDDKFLRDLIQQKLEREGFATLSAVDGETGIKMAKERSPRIILLDLILPGTDGFEVLRRLKEYPNTKAIPVVVISNLGQKEDMERALQAGAEDFMVKAHFTPSEIVSKVKAILQKTYF